MGVLSTILGWLTRGRPPVIERGTASITIYRSVEACISTDMHDAEDWEGCKD